MGSLAENTLLRSNFRNTPHSAEFELAVVNKLWGMELMRLEYLKGYKYYRAYFSHVYHDLSKAACSGDHKLAGYTHYQILETADTLKSSDQSREQIASCLSGDPGQIDRSMILAAGILIPFNFRGIGGARRGEYVTWENNESLKSLATRKAASLKTSMNHGRTSCLRCLAADSTIRFPKSFTARQLENVAGFKIIWTSNLLDHLLIPDDDETVKVHIYHQVTLLQNHKALPSTLIPLDLISETFDTLSLLLPKSDRKLRKWYSKLQERHILDPAAVSCDYLKLEDREIEHFKYWGERLSKLKKAYDDHEPTGPLQWWRDDRKPVQWWTFWIAAVVLLLTIVFGFIQSVTAILQVMKS